MQHDNITKLTSKSSELEVDTRVNQVLKQCSFVSPDDIQNCILPCIEASKQLGLINYAPKDQMIAVINAVISYLSSLPHNFTQTPSKELLSSVNGFMSDLMSIIDTACGQYGDKLPHSSNKYKTIRKCFEQSLLDIENKIRDISVT